MKSTDFGTRILKLGGCVACLGGAFVTALAVGMTGNPTLLIPTAGYIAGAGILAKQAVLPNKSENNRD